MYLKILNVVNLLQAWVASLHTVRKAFWMRKIENRKTSNLKLYSPPKVDRIWGIWGSYYKLPKAIFYLLKGDYSFKAKASCWLTFLPSSLSLGVLGGAAVLVGVSADLLEGVWLISILASVLPNYLQVVVGSGFRVQSHCPLIT